MRARDIFSMRFVARIKMDMCGFMFEIKFLRNLFLQYVDYDRRSCARLTGNITNDKHLEFIPCMPPSGVMRGDTLSRKVKIKRTDGVNNKDEINFN